MTKFQLIIVFLLSTLLIIFGFIAYLLSNISDNTANIAHNISLLMHVIREEF